MNFGGMKFLDWLVFIAQVAAIWTILSSDLRGPFGVSVLAAALVMVAGYFLLRGSKAKSSLWIPAAGVVCFFVVNNMPWTKQVRFEVLDATGWPYGYTTTLPTYWILGLLAIVSFYILATHGVINLKKYLPF